MTATPEDAATTPVVIATQTRLEHVIEQSRAIFRRAASVRRLDASELDELIQEVRLRLWKALANGREAEELSGGYVHRAAMTAAIDIIRKRQSTRFTRLANNESDVATVSPSRADADAHLDDLARVLEEVLSAIIPERATVVRLHLTGYLREDIASLLGWTEAKTRNLLYRGLHDVRTALEQRGYAR